MKIFVMTEDGLNHPTATVHQAKGKLHYNIKHGSVGRNLWYYRLQFHSGVYQPTTPDDTMLVDDSDYNIIPIKNAEGNGVIKDSIGNTVYTVVKNTCNDIRIANADLVFTTPPINAVSGSFTVNGINSMSHRIIGIASIGVDRGEAAVTITSPIVEVYGDTTIAFDGVDINGDPIGYRFNRINNVWSRG